MVFSQFSTKLKRTILTCFEEMMKFWAETYFGNNEAWTTNDDRLGLFGVAPRGGKDQSWINFCFDLGGFRWPFFCLEKPTIVFCNNLLRFMWVIKIYVCNISNNNCWVALQRCLVRESTLGNSSRNYYRWIDWVEVK